ncbi:extracellular solute-binding protein [Pseudomonas sp.]|uniref:extracellular solute-binding protein n=1 Tax=Pseudomonas sp. TaxID=306 RepID=UPI002C822AAE|nr:extracellular solute-binding protein [Pseudomonas sp.]HUE92257.1 extracellular solute-binding protein [Pseudomonas sp.]
MKYLLCILALLTCAESQAEDVLRFYSWKDYFDPGVLEDFQKARGIRVDYHAFTTTDELILAMKNGDAYDVIVPSHFMLRQLISEGKLAPIDTRRLSNHSTLDPWLLSTLAGIASANQHAVPYLWGSIGMVVNSQLAQPVYGEALPNSWGLLFDESKAARLASCGLSMPDAPEESTSLLLNYQGRRLSSASSRQIGRSLQALEVLAPRLRSLDNWEHIDELANGRLCLAMSWSGHAIHAMERNPMLTYRIPEEGAAIYIDTLAIPSNAPNPEHAYDFIDFLIAPKNAIRNARATKFYAPLASSSAEMLTFAKDHPMQVLSTEQRRRSYLLESLKPEQKQALDQSWEQFKAARH